MKANKEKVGNLGKLSDDELKDHIGVLYDEQTDKTIQEGINALYKMPDDIYESKVECLVPPNSKAKFKRTLENMNLALDTTNIPYEQGNNQMPFGAISDKTKQWVKDSERWEPTPIFVCEKPKLKILCIGNARHGKDSLGEILEELTDLKAISSSWILNKEFLFDLLNSKYNKGYKTLQESFDDRVNNREIWFKEIEAYNTPDKTATARLILKEAQIYTGMRSSAEVKACLEAKLFDLVIWVDASKRVPDESPESFNISKDVADIIIENNGTLDEFRQKIINLVKCLKINLKK